MMSEAELHHIKQRMHAGARHKAERGELRLALPVGLTRLPTGEVIFTPDEEVQARLQLVFEKFRDLKSAAAVMRFLRRAGLPLPLRPLRGPAPHEILWQEARASAVRAVLQNPAYAGAYVYGRKILDPTRRTPDHPGSGRVQQPLDQWEICLQDVYPAYIPWAEFVANQAQLQANHQSYREEHHGVPRKGQALLQGIARCGRCGALLHLRYSGPQGEYPVYECSNDQHQYGGQRCQEVRAIALDAQVEQSFLDALQPDCLALALAALGQVEQEEQAQHRQWSLRLERARYEAQRAERQYQAVEPENRLVARSLEKQWEEKLRAVEAIEREGQIRLPGGLPPLTEIDRQTILALGTDLPALWAAPSTSSADRKQMLRLVIREVIVDGRRERGRVWFQINWQTGAHQEYWYTRGVNGYEQYVDLDAVQQRVRDLNAAGHMDAEIAAALNAEGYRTARLHRPFTGGMVWRLRQQWGIPTAKINNGKARNPAQWEDGTFSIEGTAAMLGVFPGTVYKWLKVGKLRGEQRVKGMPWKVPLSPEDVTRLQEWLRRMRRVRKAPGR